MLTLTPLPNVPARSLAGPDLPVATLFVSRTRPVLELEAARALCTALLI